LRLEARLHRRAAREALSRFPGGVRAVEELGDIVEPVAEALKSPEKADLLPYLLAQLERIRGPKLVSAIGRMQTGGRDIDELCDGLDLLDAQIVDLILTQL
jgi:hypothetical protein